MYVTALKATGYRNLDGTVGLHSGLAVLVGENNAGKSNVIDALRTVLEPEDPSRGRLWVREDDFAHDGHGERKADELELEVRLAELTKPEQARLATCLSPDDGEDTAKLRIKTVIAKDGRPRTQWFGGNSENPAVDAYAREAIRFVYLHPLRDAAADLRPGRDNKLVPLLSALTPENHADRAKIEKIVEDSNAQLGTVDSLITAQKRVGDRLDAMTGSARFRQQSTLAFNDPKFRRIVGALRAKIGQLSPLEMEENGLGFNNLLYMAVLLAAMTDAPDEEEPTLRVLLVEEPEAHLHPQLQDLLMRFLESEAGKGNQVIVTSHSPHFASAASVERLTVMSRGPAGTSPRAHLPAQFGLQPEQLRYLRRFLDVTKAALFFASGVILVEGVAEQLLVPVLARRLGISLPDAGVTVINVNGVAFPPFTDLFGPDRLPYPLAVISDSDPAPGADETDDADAALSPRARRLAERASANVDVFLAERTFEWDLARAPDNRPAMLEALTEIKPRAGPAVAKELEGKSDEEAASLILARIQNAKGVFAQALAELLADDEKAFVVPEHLAKAIAWAVQDLPASEPEEASGDAEPS